MTSPPAPPPDREARYRAFFAQSHPDLLRFAQRRVHPSHAEDVVADAFLVAWRRFDEAPATPGDQRAWLFGIARNCLLNARRGEQRRAALAVRVAGAEPGEAGWTADEIAERVDLVRAWHRLDAAQQEVLALTAFDDLTSAQAARVLSTTAAGYRLRLMRARRSLRRHLDPTGPLLTGPITPALTEPRPTSEEG